MLRNLQEDVFTSESFNRIEEHISFVPDESPIVAEDDLGGRYSYAEGFPQAEPDIDARAWLGVVPDRPAPEWDSM